MMMSGYCVIAVVLVVAMALALLVMYHHWHKQIDELQLRNDELVRQRADDGRELKKLRCQNERLVDDVRERRHFMYWAARELNEHTDAQSRDAIIDKMVELTYYENLAEELPLGFVHVNQLCRELVDEYQKRVPESVCVDYKTSMPDFYAVRTNRECLEKVMRNLLENAVKYTVKGLICVEASDQVGCLEVSVSDTGCGISQERRKAIFSLLNPVRHMKRRISTGLNISRTLVERLGGSLYIDPHYTKGTSVKFSIAI